MRCLRNLFYEQFGLFLVRKLYVHGAPIGVEMKLLSPRKLYGLFVAGQIDKPSHAARLQPSWNAPPSERMSFPLQTAQEIHIMSRNEKASPFEWHWILPASINHEKYVAQHRGAALWVCRTHPTHIRAQSHWWCVFVNIIPIYLLCQSNRLRFIFLCLAVCHRSKSFRRSFLCLPRWWCSAGAVTAEGNIWTRKKVLLILGRHWD